MKSQLRSESITPRTCLAAFLLGILPVAACDQSNSVGQIGNSSAAAGSTAGSDGDGMPAGGATASGAVGAAGGGTTSGQAGASGGGKAGAAGSGAMDAGVDRYQCPPTNLPCPAGTTTDAYGCTVCAPPGTGGSAVGGTTAKGGAGGTRSDAAAAADAHQCSSQGYINCTNYTYDAYGCKLCDFSGTGGSSGGTSGKGGAGGGSGGTSGATGSGGTSGKDCQRMTKNDATCRSLNLPPQAYFCSVPTSPASTACVAYDGIDSGDAYCCPEPYLACPDSPPTNSTACTGTTACTYGSHPDPTCRTSASCLNGTWRVFAPPSRCSDPQLPATCPATPVTGTACSSHGLTCAYADGNFCTCNNCTVEDPLCNPSANDKWRCWTPPGSNCPTYYPNLGATCTLPASASCQYTCAARTTCSAAGMWVDAGNMCPN